MGRARTGERRPTDAVRVRAHWFALPLLRALEGEGLVEVRLEEGEFHVYAGMEEGGLVYGEGSRPGSPTPGSSSMSTRARPSRRGS